jgi:poly(3-hydroxybutyrate) depolymerase
MSRAHPATVTADATRRMTFCVAMRRMTFCVAAALVLALPSCVTTPAGAPAAVPVEHAGQIQSRTYLFEPTGERLPYTLYVPASYQPQRAAPLIVALHGLGSNPEQIIRYDGLTDLAAQRGYVVVAPMGYNTRGWYGSRGPGRASTRGDAANDPENLGELSQQDVLNVLALVRAEFNIDPGRIYLFGHSMGGGGTLHLAMTYPSLWAALAPVAPAIYSSPDGLAAITHIPVIVIQGDRDQLVSVEVTRRWVERMRELGMHHHYIEVAGGDHTALIARDTANMRRIFDFFDDAGNPIRP